MSKRKNKRLEAQAPPAPREAPIPAMPDATFLGGLRQNDILVVGDSFEPKFEEVVQVFRESGKFIHVPNAVGVSYLRAN